MLLDFNNYFPFDYQGLEVEIHKQKEEAKHETDFYYSCDQFFTKPYVAIFCLNKLHKILEELEINEAKYTYLEPSIGSGVFFNMLPKDRRIGIELYPTKYLEVKNLDYIQADFLQYSPPADKKYIVIGNPPFGKATGGQTGGSLAVDFINKAGEFADVIGFILPSVFEGEKVRKNIRADLKLAYSIALPGESFRLPDRTPYKAKAVFQIYTKIQQDKIKKIWTEKTCDSYVQIKNFNRDNKSFNSKDYEDCDLYLFSTGFKFRLIAPFEMIRQGRALKFLKERERLITLFKTVNLPNICYTTTNHRIQVYSSFIKQILINNGFYDVITYRDILTEAREVIDYLREKNKKSLS